MKMNYFKIYTVLLSFFAAQSLWASTSAHGEPVVVPKEMIFQQAFNFSIAIFVLWYFLRKTVKAHFQSKHEEYHDIVSQVENAKLKAQDLKKTLQEKMIQLKSEAQENAHKAKAEADEMHQKLVHDAKGLSEKLLIDARASIDIELEKAKQHLKSELLEMSIEQAQKDLKTGVSDQDHKRLKEEFVENIQGVH